MAGPALRDRIIEKRIHLPGIFFISRNAFIISFGILRSLRVSLRITGRSTNRYQDRFCLRIHENWLIPELTRTVMDKIIARICRK
jgi:hypothetical protein